MERWKTFITEHKTAPAESGGVGHALAAVTRQKLAAGHLSRSEIAELNRLKNASRANSSNSGDAHPAVAPDVGTEHGAFAVMKQPAASSKKENDTQPRKRLCLEVQAPTSPSIAGSTSFVWQQHCTMQCRERRQ